MARTTVVARPLIGNGFPPDEGAVLAARLLERSEEEWQDLEVDVHDLPASLLISAFFNAFLQHVFEARPQLLERARILHWTVAYPFQRENVTRWMHDFKPVQQGTAHRTPSVH